MRNAYISDGVDKAKVIAEAQRREPEPTLVHYHSYRDACSRTDWPEGSPGHELYGSEEAAQVSSWHPPVPEPQTWITSQVTP